MKFVCEFTTRKGTAYLPLEIAELLADSRSKDFSKERATGAGIYPRAELDNKPKFRKFAGPMWNGITEDGEGILRYESWETYDILSR